MKNESIFLLVCLLIILYLKLTNRLNAISFLLDALCLPAILSILLKLSGKRILLKYRSFIYLFFFLNAVIAITEKVTGHFLFNHSTYNFDYFRSSAIYGHPLNNALIMSVLTVALYFGSKNTLVKLAVLFFGILSIFCFGARGALIGIFLGIVLNSFFPLFTFKRKKGNSIKALNGFIYLFILAIASVIIINYSGLGDRISALSHLDHSAEARISSFDVLHGLRLRDLLWGYGPNDIDYFQYTSGVEIIENFWIVWLLKFGIIATLLLSISLISFLYNIMSSIQKDIKIPLLFVLFFVASTNNSLSTNTLVLSLFVLTYYILFDSSKEHKMPEFNHSIL